VQTHDARENRLSKHGHGFKTRAGTPVAPRGGGGEPATRWQSDRPADYVERDGNKVLRDVMVRKTGRKRAKIDVHNKQGTPQSLSIAPKTNGVDILTESEGYTTEG